MEFCVIRVVVGTLQDDVVVDHLVRIVYETLLLFHGLFDFHTVNLSGPSILQEMFVDRHHEVRKRVVIGTHGVPQAINPVGYA